MIHDPLAVNGPFGSTYLGQSGLKVSKICMGTMTFGDQVKAEEAYAMMDLAFDRGVFFFDTANAYTAGESERILGQWARDKRDRVVIATKVRYQVGSNHLSVGLSRRTIIREVENSLRRLNTDNIDLLYLHQPDERTDSDETLRACDDLVSAGKVHTIGLSNFAAWQVAQLIERSSAMNGNRPWVYQLMYNLIVRNAEVELLPCCRHYSMAVYAYNPLAAGLLTGKHSLNNRLSEGRFAVLPYYVDRYWHESFFKTIEQLRVIASASGCSLIGLAYRWLFQNPIVTGVVIGASSLIQLKSNFDEMDGKLSQETGRQIDALWRSLNSPIPSYNR